MNAMSSGCTSPSPRSRHLLATTIDDDMLTVRATTVWPISEVLDFEGGFGDASEQISTSEIDSALIIDALESRMIVPPPRRRRQRTVSSRAMFYAGN